jgi:hypothetical protein
MFNLIEFDNNDENNNTFTINMSLIKLVLKPSIEKKYQYFFDKDKNN